MKQSFTAKDAKETKEKESSTAKDAKDAKEKIIGLPAETEAREEPRRIHVDAACGVF
jgi:hypothetical protein